MAAKKTVEKPKRAKANRSSGSMQRMGRVRWWHELETPKQQENTPLENDGRRVREAILAA